MFFELLFHKLNNLEKRNVVVQQHKQYIFRAEIA